MKRLLLCSVLFFVFACQKEDTPLPPVPCEVENWGQVRITNELNTAVDVCFDGVFQIRILQQATRVVEKVTPGNYLVEAKTGVVTYSKSFVFERCRINEVIIVP
ncbi:MAG: hypothetical protein HRU41_33625 [Saprospiraceae bacterium]|nr:hypothetical protein [Saprospiraceae bacterium]